MLPSLRRTESVGQMKSRRASAHAGLLLGSAVVGALLASAPGSIGDARSLGPAATPDARTSECNGTVTATLSAGTVRLCDTVTVTARAEPVCPVCQNGVKVVFIQPYKVEEIRWMKEQALEALNVLAQDRQSNVKVGVVHYDLTAVRERLRLTANINQARGPLIEPEFGHGQGDAEGAAREAVAMIRADREPGSGQGDERCEYVIFFVAAKTPSGDVGALLRAAQSIHRERITLFVGCPAPTQVICDYVRPMAKSLANYTQSPEPGKLGAMVRRSMAELEQASVLSHLELTQVLDPQLRYVDSSASVTPTEQVVLADGRTELRWVLGTGNVPTEPHTVTYAARPLAEGTFDITGTLKLTDLERKSRHVIMPSVSVTVAGSCVTPTSEPAATDTPVPATTTATESPSRTPTPSETPQMPPVLFLPILVSELPCTRPSVMDVALVLDVSSSMLEESPSKLEQARNAVRAFLSRLDPNDQVALVVFAGEALLAEQLTTDTERISQALDVIRTGETTRLDIAIETAHGELVSARSTGGATKVMVVLTDGIPNPVPGSVALEKASAAKLDAIQVFTIGLGSDVDSDLLREIASAPDWYFEAPSSEDLLAIYTRLPETVPCGPESYWPRR